MDEKVPTKGEGPGQKKPYLAPLMEKVSLCPEEAVLGFCKNDNVRGPRGAKCRPAVCSTQGS